MTERVVLDEQLLGSDYIDPRSLESVPIQVENFCEAVRHVSEPRAIDVAGIIGEPQQTNKPWSQESVDEVSKAMEGHPYGRLYVDGETTDGTELRGITQQVRLARTSVAETSAHNVFFAKMLGYGGGLRVAVKPHENGTERLAAEWVNTLIAKRLGYGAFASLGIIRTQEGGYILTSRRDDVEPMDSTEWQGALSGTVENEAMMKDLVRIGPLMAGFHDKGGFHGDPQMKNIVIDQQDTLDFIDWEAAKIYSKPEWGKVTDGQEEQLRSGATRDLKILFGSLARSVEKHGVGLLDGLTPAAQWSFFRQFILNPYTEERMKRIDDQYPDSEQALLHLTQIEVEIENYIIDGELYKTLSRNEDHE